MKDSDFWQDWNRVEWGNKWNRFNGENKNQLNYKKSEEFLDNVNSETLVQVFRAGSVAKIKKDVLGSAFSNVNLTYLKQSFGSIPLFTHRAQTLPIGNFIDRLLQDKDELDKEIATNNRYTHYASKQRSILRFLELYGVVNLRRLDALYRELPFETFADWSMTSFFLWMGYSVGGLHYDEHDNVLFQVNGTKKVLIFPRKYTDVIDGGHYPKRVPVVGFLNPAVLQEHPWMEQVPYYEMELNPGEAVTIPAYTYHAPLALSHDSISINAFLIPHPKKLDLIPDTKEFTVIKNNPHNLRYFLMCKASSWWFALTGRALLKHGIYEFF